MSVFSNEQKITALHKRVIDLKARLEKGWDICDRNPDDKRLEDHWLDLLAQYQRAVWQLHVIGGKE